MPALVFGKGFVPQFFTWGQDAYKGLLDPSHHVGFEAACWYWQFVDVVWLFLFMIVYLWGGQ